MLQNASAKTAEKQELSYKKKLKRGGGGGGGDGGGRAGRNQKEEICLFCEKYARQYSDLLWALHYKENNCQLWVLSTRDLNFCIAVHYYWKKEEIRATILHTKDTDCSEYQQHIWW